MASTNFGDVGSGLGSIFSGIGQEMGAGGFSKAAAIAGQNAQYVKLSTGIQEEQQQRQTYQVLGATEAAAAANGATLSGSALDVFKSNSQQLALNRTLVGLQGQIDQNAWLEKQQADLGEAAAMAASGGGDILGGVLKIAAGFGSFG